MGYLLGVPLFRDKRKPTEIQWVNLVLGGEDEIRTRGRIAPTSV